MMYGKKIQDIFPDKVNQVLSLLCVTSKHRVPISNYNFVFVMMSNGLKKT